jgi:hypothetical protein
VTDIELLLLLRVGVRVGLLLQLLLRVVVGVLLQLCCLLQQASMTLLKRAHQVFGCLQQRHGDTCVDVVWVQLQ